MTKDLASYVRNPEPKQPVTGLKAAVTTDNAIVTETMMKVLEASGNAAATGVAGAMVQAAVEPFLTTHSGKVTFLYYEAKAGKVVQAIARMTSRWAWTGYLSRTHPGSYASY